MLVGRDSLEGDFPFELTKRNRGADTICWKLGILSPVRLGTSAGGLLSPQIHRQDADATGLAFHRNALQLLRARFLAVTSGSIANARLLEFIVSAVYLSRRSLYKGG